MSTGNGKKTSVVRKSFMKGKTIDNNTGKRALAYFGLMIMIVFMGLLVCSMISIGNDVLRISLNLVVEILVLLIVFNTGSTRGMEDTSRGEIMLQRENEGKKLTEKEKETCFCLTKGFAIGLLGSMFFMLLAVFLAFTTEKVLTTAGVLPTWIQNYESRSDVGEALTAYHRSMNFSLTDFARTVIRIVVMPFVSAVGSENKDALLLIDRISPLLVLIPSIAYGLGYLQGPALRSRIHTEISENQKKRRRREMKARKARMVSKGPEQLN